MIFNPKQIKICWLWPRLNAFSKRVIWIWVRGWENCRGHQSFYTTLSQFAVINESTKYAVPWIKFFNFSNWFGSLPCNMIISKRKKKTYFTIPELISPIINNILWFTINHPLSKLQIKWRLLHHYHYHSLPAYHTMFTRLYCCIPPFNLFAFTSRLWVLICPIHIGESGN